MSSIVMTLRSPDDVVAEPDPPLAHAMTTNGTTMSIVFIIDFLHRAAAGEERPLRHGVDGDTPYTCLAEYVARVCAPSSTIDRWKTCPAKEESAPWAAP
jgi:hypothetical protein